MPLPYALDHINLYLVRGEAGWTIVDTGVDTPVIRGLWEKILAGLDAPVVALICTHWHNDHAGLAGWLTERLRIPLYMSRAEYLTLRMFSTPISGNSWQHEQFYRHAGMTPAQTTELLGKLGQFALTSPPPLAYRRMEEGRPVHFGDCDWQVVTGDGHSPEHACLFNGERQILFGGDQLLARISPNIGVNAGEPDADPLRAWFASLEKVGRLPATALVLPSHELPFYGTDVRAGQLQQHHRNVLDKLLEFCREEPGSALAFARRLFTRRRSVIDDMLALTETLAHLHYLCAEGEMHRQLDEAGVYCFDLI
jgi:glyoxylase-like metal-dependent hydrolase (beta-lactamase superfamily II)